MKGRGAKKGVVLATTIVFMLIIIALSVLILSLSAATVKTANAAQNNADVRIALDAAGNEFIALVASDYDKKEKPASDETDDGDETESSETTTTTATETTSETSSSETSSDSETSKETEKEPDIKLNGKEGIEEKILKCLEGVGKDKYECTVKITGSAEQIITLIIKEVKTEKCVLYISLKRTVSSEDGGDPVTTIKTLRWSESLVASDVTEEELAKFKEKFMSLAEDESKEANPQASGFIITGLATYIRGGADGISGMFEEFGKYYNVEKTAENDEYREYSAKDTATGDIVFTYRISYSKKAEDGYMPTFTISNPSGDELLSVTVKITDGKAVEVVRTKS